MAKVRLSKTELKKQRERLARYQKFVPMMELKKQQLQQELLSTGQSLSRIEQEWSEIWRDLEKWSYLWEDDGTLEDLVRIKRRKLDVKNIAGVEVPTFGGVDFETKPWDFFSTPLWVDKGVPTLKKLILLEEEREVLEEQKSIFQKEFTTISQRLNLFEKVEIPRTQENIRKIKLSLDDRDRAAIIRGKKIKDKLGRRAR